MAAYHQPNGPLRNPSVTKHLPRGWQSCTRSRRNRRINHNSGDKIDSKRNPWKNRQPLFPAGHSPPVNMLGRPGYPSVAVPEPPGSEYQRQLDHLLVHSPLHYLHRASCCSYPVSSMLSNLYLFSSNCFPLIFVSRSYTKSEVCSR